uniref:Mitochondrial ribosomal protein L55 n=1 Tax=Knipowitschia caucasica TaxID=637954 RepID=A0AAV2KVA5_KNICA
MSVCGLSMARRWSLLPRSLALWHSAALHTHTAQWNSNRSSVVRCGRQRYERSFPVLLLRPDGSTVHVRYKEPRRVLLVRGQTLCPLVFCGETLHSEDLCLGQ